MQRQTQILVYFDEAQPNYTIQREGRWIVVPVVMMTEGVRNGSGGPILHLSDYYSDAPEAWNGVPVTAGHPTDNEEVQRSVADVPQDEWVVGHIRNARVENDKLKADVYINERRAIAINPEIINYINEGRQLDVSIGAYTQDRSETGTYGDREYHAITVNYFPDHLALLPGERGACSWSDGCGIRTNKKGDDMDSYLQSLKDEIKEGRHVLNGLQDNATGFMEISGRIQSMLDRRDSEAQIHFLKELYDEYFVYEVRDRDQGTQKFFRQSYSFSEQENDVDFTGERQEVRRNVEYIPIQRNQKADTDCGCEMKRTKYNDNSDEETTMDSNKEKGAQPSSEVVTKAVGLINNEQTRLGESDRDWLLELTVNQLNKLEPKEPEAAEVTREDAIQALQEDFADVDKVKELVPGEVKEQIELGLSSYKKVRESLIKRIQSNTSEQDWPTETLEDMSTDNLQRLAKSVKAVDYSGQAPVVNSENGSGGEALYPAGVTPE